MIYLKPKFGEKPKYTHPSMRGLIGWWLMNEGAGSVLHDLSGYGHRGNFVNMSPADWGTGRRSKVVGLDDINKYIEIDDSSTVFNNLNGFTLSGWIYLNSFASQGNILVDGVHGSLWTSVEFKQNFFSINSNGGPTGIQSTNWPNVPLMQQWYHMLATWGEGNLRIFRDAALIHGPISIPDAPFNAATNITIGALKSVNDPSGTINQLDGNVDDVRIYNRALSTREIQDVYLNPYVAFDNEERFMEVAALSSDIQSVDNVEISKIVSIAGVDEVDIKSVSGIGNY